jgi:hypothetical protein
MKVSMNILRVSAGNMVDAKTSEKIVYASAIVLDEAIANQIDSDRIDVGQQHAKVKISTENNNQLSRELASSGLIPGDVNVHVKTSVKSGGITMEITGFEPKRAAA